MPLGCDHVEGVALRVLYRFLNEADPSHDWAGLRKMITPDGTILWLCGEHTKTYEMQSLRVE